MSEIVKRLQNLLGKDRVLVGDAIQALNTSFWDASPMQGLALLKPESTEEVSAIMRLCHEHGQAVNVIGGNTGGVQGQHTQPNEVILSMERMNRIESIDAACATAIVQAGCVLENLQQAAANEDMLFPLDLGARGSCTVGGNVSSNAGGLNVIRYGMMRDLTLGLEVVLPDGTILSSMNRLIKNNTGYDLKQLFIGSEGTLGVVTRVVVKLFEAPLSVNTALLGLDSFDKVTALLKRLRKELGSSVSSFEYMDQSYYQDVTKPGANRAPLDKSHSCYVVIEVQGTQPLNDRQLFEQVLGNAMEEQLVCDAVIAQSDAQRREIWAVRENFEPLLHETPYFLYDVSLPVSSMLEYQLDVKQKIRALWPSASCYALAHVGDNNLHWFITPRTDDSDAHSAASAIVYEPLAALHGSVSAEHGIGFEKKYCLPLSRSTAELDTMRLLKRSLDPNNILGQGRIFDL
ncbi:MAG: FAD-binding oxidoreductase [Pseudomonadales bacterium]